MSMSNIFLNVSDLIGKKKDNVVNDTIRCSTSRETEIQDFSEDDGDKTLTQFDDTKVICVV